MSYITTTNLTSIMAEMTDYCNAACPMCQRFDWDTNLIDTVNSKHTTLDFIKEKIGDEIISRLDRWICQGTYGDAIMNPETIDIFGYLKKLNPRIDIIMHTNGGVRNEDFWKNLAELDVRVTFSIDGLADTNHLYRRNVKWDKLMFNVKTFISNGGSADWEYLVFKHNQHQTSEAETLSKSMGFKNFRHYFSERWQDFDANGNYRDIKKLEVDDYIIEKPEDQPEDFVAEVIEGHNIAKNVFTKPGIDDFFTKKINCYACSVSRREIYLRANGYVSPCCWLGDIERDEPKSIIVDYNKVNLNHTSLKEIFEGKFFKDLHEGIQGGEKRLKGCYHACGVN